MEEPVFETRFKRVQWGWWLYSVLVVPPIIAAAAVILVPFYSPLYPPEYRTAAAVDDLTGTVALGLIGFVWVSQLIQVFRWHRSKVVVYADRVQIDISLFGRSKLLPLDRITSVKNRRALFGFGRYGVVKVKARGKRTMQLPGVRRHRELADAIRQGAMAAQTPSV